MSNMVNVHAEYWKTINDLSRDKAELLKHIKRLEEENNELRAEEARLLNTNGELERRIKRLEEAGDGMRIWITVIRGYLPECTNNWIKAKEAKP